MPPVTSPDFRLRLPSGQATSIQKGFPIASGSADVGAMPLILLMLVVNVPLGYLVCRHFKIRSYWKILLIGLGQYVASAFILAAVLVFTDNSPQNNTKFLNMLYLGGVGVMLFALIAVPVILLYAWFLHWWFGRKPE